MSSNKKSFFTPCRQVGLKRKSVGFTPPTPNSKQVNLPASTEINTLIGSQLVSQSPVTSLNLLQPVPKRRKTSVVRRVPSISETLTQERNKVEIRRGSEFDEASIRSEELKLDSEFVLQLEKYDALTLSDIQLLVDEIRKRVAMKQTQIAELESQTANAKKHDLESVNDLITKWRRACQQALNELLLEHKNRSGGHSMQDLIVNLGIPTELVQYSDKEMDFYD